MIRFFAALIGLGFSLVLAIGLFGSLTAETPPPTAEHEFHKYPKEVEFASDGPFGKFDERQLQRGFQVYKEVCAACHSLRLVSFRDLAGIGYEEAEIKAIAEQWAIEQPTINPETGEAATRKNIASDRFPTPYLNDVAARAANNNALPPDLSLMTKARHDGGAYVYSLLTGYQNQPAELVAKFPEAKTPEGLHFNPYFATLNIAMPQPITSEGQVTYTDGTRPTVDQMSKDVAAFLVWTAEPKMQVRKATGFGVVIFLLVFCFLAYGAYLNVWRGVKH